MLIICLRTSPRVLSDLCAVSDFKPTFNKRPLDSSQMATVSGNATIICQPEAAPAPDITWFHNGRALGLTRGVQGRVMMLDNGNLLITQVQLSDQGEYTCTATNSRGSASSSGLMTVVSKCRCSWCSKQWQTQTGGFFFSDVGGVDNNVWRGGSVG